MLVLLLGGLGFLNLLIVLKFIIEVILLMLFVVMLFGLMFRKGSGDIIWMILIGVIVGMLFCVFVGFV